MSETCPHYSAVPDGVNPKQPLIVDGKQYYDGVSRMRRPERLHMYDGSQDGTEMVCDEIGGMCTTQRVCRAGGGTFEMTVALTRGCVERLCTTAGYEGCALHIIHTRDTADATLELPEAETEEIKGKVEEFIV